MEVDIKKNKVNSEVWVRLNGIHLYLQLVKYNYSKMKAYRKGLTGQAAEFAVKKYHSHRWVPNSVLQSVDA